MNPVLSVVLLLLAVAAGLLAFRYAQGRRVRQLQATYEDVLAAHALTMTDRPAGLSDEELAAFTLLPHGDRRSSAVWGAEGPELVVLDGREVMVTCAAFEWWWEDFVATSSRPGHERSSRMAAVVRFPDASFDVAEESDGGETQWEWQGRSLLVALPVSPRGIIRSATPTDDLVSTSAAPIEALPGLRTQALALAARLVRPA